MLRFVCAMPCHEYLQVSTMNSFAAAQSLTMVCWLLAMVSKHPFPLLVTTGLSRTAGAQAGVTTVTFTWLKTETTTAALHLLPVILWSE
ncbi:hypothetical protein CHARACLAT_018325 [Characodon lateralis]|uniref:Secreted protein n=1 Tax=Characodon lateralis TaxID=208331 RepID=A0ABU7EVP8_9TELE|nr:hypothetical protein [Characodon lateralis]